MSRHGLKLGRLASASPVVLLRLPKNEKWAAGDGRHAHNPHHKLRATFLVNTHTHLHANVLCLCRLLARFFMFILFCSRRLVACRRSSSHVIDIDECCLAWPPVGHGHIQVLAEAVAFHVLAEERADATSATLLACASKLFLPQAKSKGCWAATPVNPVAAVHTARAPLSSTAAPTHHHRVSIPQGRVKTSRSAANGSYVRQ